jgi:hypothetical protein
MQLQLLSMIFSDTTQWIAGVCAKTQKALETTGRMQYNTQSAMQCWG